MSFAPALALREGDRKRLGDLARLPSVPSGLAKRARMILLAAEPLRHLVEEAQFMSEFDVLIGVGDIATGRNIEIMDPDAFDVGPDVPAILLLAPGFHRASAVALAQRQGRSKGHAPLSRQSHRKTTFNTRH